MLVKEPILDPYPENIRIVSNGKRFPKTERGFIKKEESYLEVQTGNIFPVSH